MPPTTLSGESRIRSTAGELHAGTLSCDSLLHESDERLVALTRAGSERAFAEITRRYQRALRVYCSRLVGPERAQDAVQQALLQAFLSLRDRAPREIALRPWLYRIAHNCAIDQIRMGSWEHEQLDLESDGVPQPPALLEQKEELRSLIAGMRRLPDAQRQALTLRELEGYSYEEISARLGHTGSGVRQLIFRARTALRKGAMALLPFGVRARPAGRDGGRGSPGRGHGRRPCLVCLIGRCDGDPQRRCARGGGRTGRGRGRSARRRSPPPGHGGPGGTNGGIDGVRREP